MSVVIGFDRLRVSGRPVSFETVAFSSAIKNCYFCPRCGTRLWHGSSASPDFVTLKVGTLDESAHIAPSAHLWVSKKQAGISLDPAVPVFDTQPDNLAHWREGLK
jgi:hypothetical protein